MPSDLTAKVCVPCQGGIPPLTSTEAEAYLVDTPEWELLENATRLHGAFKFEDFQTAMDFVQKIGEIAEQEGHHPDIEFGWGYANILIYTHKINGLHENDFILAAKINDIGND
ncbi:MAG: 4a-hydroxytetrahydrobiopterin dehydratase [Rhodospirillales bacterium]|jgi:4a-hydroxytetrahydrobiopterin dehydratase|nr:4a-hydroxytetrahydrobiopterin dehydratase [Rhodospirillales bacterium]|tara:strand:+ start:1331 stop:1669 length:339 start_codon:yes stop_codon:yes gene_type:complete